MTPIGFKPKTVTKRLINQLPDRSKDVLVKRFGLGDTPEIMTLEAIGGEYGITRERVRQIENSALSKIRKSGALEEHEEVFTDLHGVVHSLGGVVAEEDLLSHLADKTDLQNHFYFLLVLGDPFYKEKGNNHLKHHWHVDKTLAERVKDALDKLRKKLSKDEILSEEEMLQRFRAHLDDVPEEHHSNEEILKRWLSISKAIGRNPLGEWGPATSPNINLKGVRDYAYLVIRQHGSPLHFTEVTKRIRELFDKKAHVATTHNELIKDERFVLVGRGLYALKDWGYMEGVVKDVIAQVLRDHGPLTREEVVEKVLRERYVKPNTIFVNLQNNQEFQRLDDGRYTVVA